VAWLESGGLGEGFEDSLPLAGGGVFIRLDQQGIELGKRHEQSVPDKRWVTRFERTGSGSLYGGVAGCAVNLR
jgi:hypothetical protein